MKRKDKTLSQKLADINLMWDNGEKYIEYMPEREMFDSELEENEILLDQTYLDDNPDWVAWELELME